MDKITQVQLLVDKLSTHFFNSVGTIQRDAAPTSLGYSTQLPPPEPAPAGVVKEQMQMFAREIVSHCKQIEELIDSLPGIEDTEEEQLRKLAELQSENEMLGKQILDKIEEAEQLNSKVGEALHQIAIDKIEFM